MQMPDFNAKKTSISKRDLGAKWIGGFLVIRSCLQINEAYNRFNSANVADSESGRPANERSNAS
ncbi:hypothetical protein PAE9249_03169 [Paenibacillus sp. CECT 9249]|nr:hypothetical protein PAE9249_03169 [Paenibacillus sp. CECT 9249]